MPKGNVGPPLVGGQQATHQHVRPPLVGGRLRKHVTLLSTLLVLLVLFVTACGDSSGSSTGQVAPPDKQVLRLPEPAIDDFGTLDPALVQNSADANAIQTIFTGLAQFKNDGTLVDQLAASHTVSSDGLTYSFTLRPDLKFSDGTPLTASDVAYSINRTISPATKSPVSGYLKLLKDYDKVNTGKIPSAIGDSIIIKDNTHLDLVISRPAAYFLQTLTYPTSYVVNRRLIDRYGANWTDHLGEGAGAGPFKASSYNHTRGLDVVPNSNYYGTRPRLQKVQFIFSGDAATTYKAYLSNQYDLAGVPAANLEDAKTRKDFHQTPSLSINYLAMNYRTKPFDDINVRKAFALAIDKTLLVQSVLKGSAIPTNHLVPQGMFGYYADLKGPDGTASTRPNFDMARRALAASSYGSAAKLPPITLTYTSGSAAGKNTITAITQVWREALGIDVKTTTVESSKLMGLANATTGNTGPLQMWYFSWIADYPDPQDWLSVFFGKGADYNQFNFGQNKGPTAAHQQTIQYQLARADVTQDPAQRMRLYNDAEQKIVNEIGWIPIAQDQANVLIKRRLHGWEENPLDIQAPDAWGNIYLTT